MPGADRRLNILLATIGLGAMALVGDRWWLFVPAFAVAGLGLGMGWSYASIGTQAVVPPSQAGQASGVTLTALVSLAGVAVALCSTTISSISSNHGLDEATRIVLAALAALSLAAALPLRLTRAAGFEPATSASGGQRSIH